MEPALKKAVELSITAYDACYVALADRLGITLLTADKKLAHLVPAALWLGEL
jgi:predicted nucleic acid-binding protein